MGRNHKKHTQKKKQQAAKETCGKVNIPAGESTAERFQHDEIEIEPRVKALRGDTMISGEVVSTPIRKLLECGAITNDEADAASRFKYDYDAVHSSCKSSLCSIGMSIDGGGGADFTKQIFHAQRYNQAKNWLRPNMFSIAEAAILGTYSFTHIGHIFLPKSSNQEYIPAGKAILALVIRELFFFYADLAEKNSKMQHRRRSSDSKNISMATGQ